MLNLGFSKSLKTHHNQSTTHFLYEAKFNGGLWSPASQTTKITKNLNFLFYSFTKPSPLVKDQEKKFP